MNEQEEFNDLIKRLNATLENKSSNGNFKQMVFNAAIVVVVPVVGWLLLQVVTLGNFKSATEANRFTSQEGSSVWRKLSEIEGKIPKEVPPAWFLRDVNDIKRRLREIEEQHRSKTGNHQ